MNDYLMTIYFIVPELAFVWNADMYVFKLFEMLN